jgi:hypothetical protein
MADARSFTQGNIALILEGAQPAFCKKVEGGGQKTEVIESPQGPGKIIKKHLATAGWNDIKATIALAQGGDVLQWIQDTMDLKHSRRNGAIVTANVDMEAKHHRDFYEGVLTKTGFPALKGDSKDSPYLEVEWKPETCKTGKPSGKLEGGGSKEHKMFSCANFRVDTGLGDVANNTVAEFSGWGFNQEVILENVGHLKHGTCIATNVKFNNFDIKGSLRDVAPFEEYYEKFVELGGSGDDAELTMAVEFLHHDKKTVGFAVELLNCGITEIQYDGGEANKSARAGFTAKFYCEQMKFVKKDSVKK